MRFRQWAIVLVLLQTSCSRPNSEKKGVDAASSASAGNPFPPLGALDCDRLAAEYRAQLKTIAACSSDSDCRATMRDPNFHDLDICFRIEGKGESASADSSADRWRAGGCGIPRPRSCLALPQPVCESGICKNRRPHQVPSTWQRVEVPQVVTLFVPPEFARKPVSSDDTTVVRFSNGSITADLEIGKHGTATTPLEFESAPTIESPDPLHTLVKREEVLLEGLKTWRVFAQSFSCSQRRCPEKNGFLWGMHLSNIPSHSRIDQKTFEISVMIDCPTLEACAVAEQIVKSVTPEW